jgi:D-alanyl-D-alanine carboxypeptidase (penicillin-binding protein 5/6)
MSFGNPALFASLVGLALSAVTPHLATAAPFDRDDMDFAAAILVEAETGTVLFEHNPHALRSPASTQKLLLLLVLMEAVADGKYSLEDSVTTSAWASRMGGSQVYLKQGEVFTLGQLMEAITIASANDACVAVAEHVGGSVDGFVHMMNERAHALGLQNTMCVNVHGLDDTPGDDRNLTTASDLSRVALALLPHHPILKWSAVRYKPFRQGEFMLYTTNKLLGKYPDLDGLKTGYTTRAGFCLVATARRRDMRLVSVVMGSTAGKMRDRRTARLLSWGFNHFVKISVVEPGEQMGDVTIDWGLQPEVSAVTADTVVAVLTDGQRRRLKRKVDLPDELPAPVQKGDSLGVLSLTIGDSLLARVNLVAARSVERMSAWEMLMSYF